MKPVGRGGEPPLGNTAGKKQGGGTLPGAPSSKAHNRWLRDTCKHLWQRNAPEQGWAQQPVGMMWVADGLGSIDAGINRIVRVAVA